MKIFPDNTTACYTTKLPQELNLRGNWEVGITEIHFPRSFLHICEEETEITATYNLSPVLRDKYKNANNNIIMKKLKIPYGIYINIVEFLQTLNNSIDGVHIIFRFSVEHNNTFLFAERMCTPETCNYEHSLKMSRAILDILGFFDVESYINVDSNPCIATRPAKVLNAMPRQLFIYSDICELCIVGDVQTPILRIAPVNYKDYVFDSNLHHTFTPVSYVPLIRNSFTTIVIDLRDHLGRIVPFECGTSTVTLHFRRAH